MWSTDNRTPYGIGHSWGRNRDGVHEWLVAVRATFEIAANGGIALADEQPDARIMPEYTGEDGQSSLRYDADLVSPKPTTDVLINGTAYAPGGRSATSFLVSMRVGPIEKTLRVHGDREYRSAGSSPQPTAARPVTQVPMVYERAYGGQDTTDPDPKRQKIDLRNPVGRGVVSDNVRLIDTPVHNFEYPGKDPAAAGPGGFGAIAAHWSPRLERQGTYDEGWAKRRLPLLPHDWDPRSLQCAPVDQQPSTHLRGGELVELSQLTPAGALRFALPKIYLTFTTYFATTCGRRAEEHRSRLSSVIIEPDECRLSMVWLSALLVHRDEDYLEETVVREKAYL